MRKYANTWPGRVWAVEGSNGAGRPLAQRLLEDGEQVVDVPAKLAARVRLFDTGHNRKTDAHDAHAVAAVAVRTKTLRVLQLDGELEALRMLTDPARRTPAWTGETRHHHRPGQPQCVVVTSPGGPGVGSPPRSSPS
jgi:NAD(P)-dependent dehydrogenase (short-subunit alcohol dehydrogenase family)